MEILSLIWGLFWHLLLNILVGINSVVHSPGLSIIVFTVLIRLFTVPITVKSLRSSREMQRIQPLIKEIQKKYPKDRAKQQEETMKLYQQYGVNPAASCFPMLLQLPIFIGLYSALNFVVQLHTGTPDVVASHVTQLKSILFNDAWLSDATNFNEPFLWMPNLAAADPLHILPALSAVFQFIQSRMSIPQRDPNQPLDSQTKMMQNMMQFMPIYIFVISLGFPAGTVIYWAFSSLFGAVQQYFITGFGTLPNLPGLGWLPRKPMTQPAPPLPPPTTDIAVAKRKGVMGWMMDKAMEAQEVQKAAVQGEKELGAGENGVAEPRVKRKGSEPHVKVVPTSTVKYASDLRYRENDESNGNGRDNGLAASTASTQLPRKRRGKK